MTSLPTPPPSREVSAAPEGAEKSARSVKPSIQSLDHLLERYLHLLDRYQTLQENLGTQLSSAFLSLTHANYCSPPGRRYGEDYYDQRMKATRRISLHDPSPPGDLEEKPTRQSSGPRSYVHNFCINPTPVPHPTELDDGRQTSDNERTQDGNSTLDPNSIDTSTISNIPMSQASLAPLGTESNGVDESRFAREPPHPKDPLSWYGILVPQSLRHAQRLFMAAMEGCIPELVSVVTEMRLVEERVNDVRTRLGSGCR